MRTDLYIPPPGAMQFEITSWRSSTSIAKLLVGSAIWIYPKEVVDCSDKFCNCRPKWRVVIDSLPSNIQLAVEKAVADGRGHPCVCLCIGRIIE